MDLWGPITELWDSLVAWIEGVLNWLWSIITSAFEAVYNFGRDVLFGAVDWLLDTVVSAFEGISFDVPTLASLLSAAPEATQAMLWALDLPTCLGVISLGFLVRLIAAMVRPGFWVN